LPTDIAVGIRKGQCDWLFDQNRLAQFECPHHRFEMLMLAGGDDHCIDLRVRDYLVITARRKIGTGLFGKAACPLGIKIGYGEKFDGRMRRRHVGPQRSDSTGANHSNAEFPSIQFHEVIVALVAGSCKIVPAHGVVRPDSKCADTQRWQEGAAENLESRGS